MPFEQSCGVVMFHREKGFLLLRYTYGHWGFVKGNIEEGESEEETCLREIEEETGIQRESIYVLTEFHEKINYFYIKEKKRIYKKVTYLLAETVSNEIKLSYEHTEYVWLPYEKALKKITFKNDKNILKKAMETLEKKNMKL
jgi:8-oxo-dGTP pyrophosphatase MutT (NUDIX family)